MESILLSQFKLLPKNLQLEVLHYMQYLMQVKDRPIKVIEPRPKKKVKLEFQDFHFPDHGKTYSRSEIYGDDGR